MRLVELAILVHRDPVDLIDEHLGDQGRIFAVEIIRIL